MCILMKYNPMGEYYILLINLKIVWFDRFLVQKWYFQRFFADKYFQKKLSPLAQWNFSLGKWRRNLFFGTYQLFFLAQIIANGPFYLRNRLNLLIDVLPRKYRHLPSRLGMWRYFLVNTSISRFSPFLK